MYRAHFRLNEWPFTITPDTRFFFSQSSHQEALNTLLVAVEGGEGFIKVTGEVGTGKTLLCRKFLAALDHHNFISAYIPNPYLQPMTLLLAIADELGIEYPPAVNQHQLLKLLTRYLIEAYAGHKRVVVCLDEVQAMPLETLESLRLLTNLETERRKLLQVVLFGQPELNQRLELPAVRQLRQRITFTCRLRPFTKDETGIYLAHRLRMAGCAQNDVFDAGAVRALYRASGGVPRLINILAHKCLLAAYGEGTHRVDTRHVNAAVADTESLEGRSSWQPRLWRALKIAAVVMIAGLSAVVWGHWQ